VSSYRAGSRARPRFQAFSDNACIVTLTTHTYLYTCIVIMVHNGNYTMSSCLDTVTLFVLVLVLIAAWGHLCRLLPRVAPHLCLLYRLPSRVAPHLCCLCRLLPRVAPHLCRPRVLPVA
jgi:hypothetical protein